MSETPASAGGEHAKTLSHQSPQRPQSPIAEAEIDASIRDWNRAHQGHLTPDQQGCIHALEVRYACLRKYDQGTPEQHEATEQKRRLFKEDQKAFDVSILEADRLGLSDHPLVQQRLPHLRTSRDTGYTPAELETEEKIIKALTTVVLKQTSFTAIYQQLAGEQTIPHKSRQGFYKFCERRNLFALAELSASETIADADQILAFLATHGTLSRTALSALFGRHVPARRIANALTYLAGEQLISTTTRQHPQRGRPATIIQLKMRNNSPLAFPIIPPF